MRWVSALVIVVGILAIAGGILYVSVPAHSLPSFFPGYIAHAKAKHTSRGEVGLAIGAVLVVIGAVLAISGRRGLAEA
jgi:hypothetical protein